MKKDSLKDKVLKGVAKTARQEAMKNANTDVYKRQVLRCCQRITIG